VVRSNRHGLERAAFINAAHVVDPGGDLYAVTPGTGRPLRTIVPEISVEIESAGKRHLAGRGEHFNVQHLSALTQASSTFGESSD
jgi:hypothetical protein